MGIFYWTQFKRNKKKRMGGKKDNFLKRFVAKGSREIGFLVVGKMYADKTDLIGKFDNIGEKKKS